MRAGALRNKIVIYERTDAKESDFGSVDEVFSEYLTTRAEVRHISGNEVLQNETIANVAVVVFIMRYRQGVNEKMEIGYGDYRYNIKIIEENTRKTMLKLTCQKIVN